MKKVFVVTALVVGLGFFSAQQASANWGMNGGAGMGCESACNNDPLTEEIGVQN